VIYSSGVWTAKEGREGEFVRTWERDVTTLPAEHPGLVARLLRDTGDSRRFVSVVGPWRSVEALEAVRRSPAFEEGMERARELLDSVETFTYELVLEVS
jgi:heme-degrading monooxygenase HmoA